ncbi:MAG: DUF1315 family protein [Pseudomonadales bacterium]|nr:DUF1315 family protein [Pseudomonadales bacterium]MCP5357478.1 DUF1315 family protein [Pseudomonadales bacterium]
MTEKPDSLESLINSITPEIHENLKTAVETGRWANGERLSQEQVEHCMQAIIAYEARHLREDQRIGFIDTSGLNNGQGPSHHHEEGGACESEPAPMTWVGQDGHTRH